MALSEAERLNLYDLLGIALGEGKIVGFPGFDLESHIARLTPEIEAVLQETIAAFDAIKFDVYSITGEYNSDTEGQRSRLQFRAKRILGIPDSLDSTENSYSYRVGRA